MTIEPPIPVPSASERRIEGEHDHWRYFSDGVGELLPFCPGCAEREFGISRTITRPEEA
jgi:hypothetical protein